MTTACDPIQLTTQLMSIDSTSGREGEVIAWLDRELSGRGWRTRRIPVTEGRDDLFATVHDAPLVEHFERARVQSATARVREIGTKVDQVPA